jgi:hypothetical protein
MKAHSDDEIIKLASKEIQPELVRDNKIDIAVDLEDEHGTMHTYVVTFQCNNQEKKDWKFLEINELSSL